MRSTYRADRIDAQILSALSDDPRATTMALVNDDEVKEVGWILAKVRRRLAVFWRAGHEVPLCHRRQDSVPGAGGCCGDRTLVPAAQRLPDRGRERFLREFTDLHFRERFLAIVESPVPALTE